MRRSPRRGLATLLALAVLVGACGSDSPAVDEALPFDAVLNELFGTDHIAGYRYDIQRDAEARMIDCMNDAGFEFVIEPAVPPDVDPDRYRDRGYVETDGFGIITRFRDWLATVDIEAQRIDRNGQYLATLSGDEVQRFYLTLDGEPAEPGQLPENPGCRGAASDQAYETWNAFLAALPNYTAMGEERDTHPDWLAARADWRDCMLAEGYDYFEPDEIRSDVEDRMTSELAEDFPGGGLPLTFDGEDWVLDPAADETLDELKVVEVAAATANLECTEPLLDRFDAVDREVQQGFVDRNQEAIDQLLGEQR